MQRRGCAAFAVLASFAVATTAAADPLADAKTQVAASDYLNARASLDAAYAAGGNRPDQLAEIWRLRGIVAGALGDNATATDAFQRCLALDPKAELPPGTSPKIGRPFTAARDYFKSHEPLKIKSETAGTPPSITVLIPSDPLAMIAKIEVTVSVDHGAEKTLDGTGKDKVKIDLPVGSRLDLRVAALDEKGNHLAELGSTDVPIVIVGPGKVEEKKTDLVIKQPPPKKPSGPVHARPWYFKWWLWGGTAVAFGGVATYFGIDGFLAKRDLEDLNAESPNHTFDEATDIEDRARRDFLFANIGYGVAGALAIGAVILYLTEPDQPTKEQRLTAVPLEGGGAIVLGGHF